MMMAISAPISIRLESMTSASAPAGSVNRNKGRLTATCTSDTVIGLALRLVINQPEAVSNIAVPTFETVLAVHITVNARWLNGPHREGVGAAGAAAVVRSAPVMAFSGIHISLQASLHIRRRFPWWRKH